MNKISPYFTCFFILFTLFFACTSAVKKNENADKVDYKGETLLVPDSLVTYSPFNKNNLDSSQIANSALKIYSYVDVSCPSCLTNINNWNKISADLKEYKMPIILVCQSEDNYELLKYLCEKKDIREFPYPFYFDIKNQFFSLNKFLNAAPNNHTVLTDKDSRVLVSGDPTRSEKIKNLYLDIIKSYKP